MEKNTDLFLVIDMQNVYTKGQEWACEGMDSATASILRVLNADVCPNVVFTRYLAPEYPVGIWKEYNKVNANGQRRSICKRDDRGFSPVD